MIMKEGIEKEGRKKGRDEGNEGRNKSATWYGSGTEHF